MKAAKTLLRPKVEIVDPAQIGIVDPARERTLARLRSFATLLDSAIPIPGTSYRIGLDPIMGLLPGIGDSLGAVCGGFIVLEAARLGAPKRTLVKMLGAVAIDGIVGTVPLFGDLFDATWKCNQRNMDSLVQLPDSAWGAPRSPTQVGRLLAIPIIGIVVGLGVIALVVLAAFFKLLSNIL